MKKYLLIILLFVSANALATSPSPFSSNESAATQSSAVNASEIETDELEAESPEANKKRPRLKFKSKGPACMCADGLSEKDIQQQQIRPKSRDN